MAPLVHTDLLLADIIFKPHNPTLNRYLTWLGDFYLIRHTVVSAYNPPSYKPYVHQTMSCLLIGKILSGRTGEATHDGSSTYPIEHTFYGPSRHVNLGLVGNQQNEWSANMYTFRRHLMFHEYFLSEIFIKNYNLAWTSYFAPQSLYHAFMEVTYTKQLNKFILRDIAHNNSFQQSPSWIFIKNDNLAWTPYYTNSSVATSPTIISLHSHRTTLSWR